MAVLGGIRQACARYAMMVALWLKLRNGPPGGPAVRENRAAPGGCGEKSARYSGNLGHDDLKPALDMGENPAARRGTEKMRRIWRVIAAGLDHPATFPQHFGKLGDPVILRMVAPRRNSVKPPVVSQFEL